MKFQSSYMMHYSDSLWILLDISVCKYMYMNYFALMDRDNELFILSLSFR